MPWNYRADPPQRYSSNYKRYLERGGAVRFEEDVAGFVATGKNDGDMARYYFFCLALDQMIKEELPGDLAEIGVYKGETATLIATIARRLGKTAWLLDTFEGFDAKDLQGIDYGLNEQFDDTSLEAVRALVGEENVHFIKGYFPDTAAQLPAKGAYCLVHIDCDLYNPVRAALDYFYPRIVPGGFLLVHDYSSLHWDGAEQAVDEFFADKPESPIPLTDGAGTIAIRKHKGTNLSQSWYAQKRRAVFAQGWVEASNVGPTRLFLGEGWAQPEEWGVWGVGEKHVLRLYAPVPPPNVLELDCDVHVVLIGPRKSQRVDVFVGTQLLDSWEFTPDFNRAVRSLQVPVPKKSASVTIEFRPHSVAMPAELAPGNLDTRPLGLALHRLRLSTTG
jgi:hypothetical protein